MKITLDEFHRNLSDQDLIIITRPHVLGVQNAFGQKFLEEGAIQTVNGYDLRPSFRFKDDTFWGVYTLIDNTNLISLQPENEIWKNELREVLNYQSPEFDDSDIEWLEAKYEVQYDKYLLKKDQQILDNNDSVKVELPFLDFLHNAKFHRQPTVERPFCVKIRGHALNWSRVNFFKSVEEMIKWFDWASYLPRDREWFDRNMMYSL